MKTVHRECDALILGCGVSGLYLALHLADSMRVLIVSKGAAHASNSWWAQGGVAAVLDPKNDSSSKHVHDTLSAGAGMCHKDIVEFVVERGPAELHKLIEWGVPFSKKQQDLHLTLEGGHSERRVAHVKDHTGQSIMEVLLERAFDHPNIDFLNNHMAIDLVVSDQVEPTFEHNACFGAYLYNMDSHEVCAVNAAKTFLCTGGHGRLYQFTSNPEAATGDGVAMAWRAGCRVANLEFMQFHPTCLFSPKLKTFLISEAVRGEGAVLLDHLGNRFMQDVHPQADLAPRDIVSRAIDKTIKSSGHPCVYLDIEPIGLDRFKDHFPSIAKACERAGIDLSALKIPVVPAAHYSCGGVVVDKNAATNVKNLSAIGEVACSGLHGANRLASNSLLENLVFARHVGEINKDFASKKDAKKPKVKIPNWDASDTVSSKEERVVTNHSWDEIRRMMWNYVGIHRSDSRLLRAKRRISQLRQEIEEFYWLYELTPEIMEVRNLSLVAELTVQCAMKRKESRGIHLTTDYLEQKAKAIDTIIR